MGHTCQHPECGKPIHGKPYVMEVPDGVYTLRRLLLVCAECWYKDKPRIFVGRCGGGGEVTAQIPLDPDEGSSSWSIAVRMLEEHGGV